jgi:BirA family biotin operon repressor/biotin-[acetyl-CoA-carboxylase] ligase
MLKPYIPGKTIKIKWPNDILADGRKIAGILIQNAISGRYIRHSVIGIGLNINQGYFPGEIPEAISLKMLLDREVDRKEILGNLFLSLNTSLRMMLGQPEKIDEAYINSLYRIDVLSNYRVKGRVIQGTITGVDEFGRLELQENDGELHNLDIKEIEYLV